MIIFGSSNIDGHLRMGWMNDEICLLIYDNQYLNWKNIDARMDSTKDFSTFRLTT